MGKNKIYISDEEKRQLIWYAIQLFQVDNWIAEIKENEKVAEEIGDVPLLGGVHALFETVYLLDKKLYDKVRKLKPEEGIQEIIKQVTGFDVAAAVEEERKAREQDEKSDKNTEKDEIKVVK